MKRTIIIFLIVGIALLVTTFSFKHAFPRSYHHTFTKTTDLSTENVEGLFLHDDFYSKEIIERYGKKAEQNRNTENYHYYELREGIEVATNKSDEITRFIITDKNVETVKGIKIGDNKEDVIKAYGKNYYSRAEQGFNIIGYVDKEKNISIEFWLTNGRVEFYKFDDTSME